MRCWNFLAHLALAILFLAPIAAAQTPEAKSDLAANAAVQYWQAFAQMPVLDKSQEKLLEDWNKVPFDAATLKLLDGSQASLMYLHRGAKLERCDWGLDYNDGISLLLPHLAKARDLARLAALRARHAFEQGNMKGGRADATSMMALARHVGRDPIMIGMMVRYLIEGTVVDLIAPYATKINAPYPQIVSMFQALPPAATLQQSILVEKKFMVEWMIGKLAAEEKRRQGAGMELWKKMLDGPTIPDTIKRVKTLEEVTKLAEELLPVYDQLEKLVALPRSEFESQYPTFKQKTEAAHPMASVLLPALDKIVAKEHRNQARMAMLLAGFAVAQGGPEKLADIADPFGDGPFEHRALERGFELKSKLRYEGQAVTLTIGQRAK